MFRGAHDTNASAMSRPARLRPQTHLLNTWQPLTWGLNCKRANKAETATRLHGGQTGDEMCPLSPYSKGPFPLVFTAIHLSLYLSTQSARCCSSFLSTNFESPDLDGEQPNGSPAHRTIPQCEPTPNYQVRHFVRRNTCSPQGLGGETRLR